MKVIIYSEQRYRDTEVMAEHMCRWIAIVLNSQGSLSSNLNASIIMPRTPIIAAQAMFSDENFISTCLARPENKNISVKRYRKKVF